VEQGNMFTEKVFCSETSLSDYLKIIWLNSPTVLTECLHALIFLTGFHVVSER
jgi:hypothetical protein